MDKALERLIASGLLSGPSDREAHQHLPKRSPELTARLRNWRNRNANT